MTALPAPLSTGILSRLELLRVHTRKQYFGLRQGRHISLRKGVGMEFADHRKYELGDNPRHIDWGLYGRSEKLYVKTFQQEEDIGILIVVDGSSSMRTSQSGAKWNRALALALSLAYVSLLGRDRVSVHIAGIYESPYYSHPQTFHDLTQSLMQSSVKHSNDYDLYTSFRRSMQSLKLPGLVFFISDFLFEESLLANIVRACRIKNIDTTFFATLAREDVTLSDLPRSFLAQDSETADEVHFYRDNSVDGEYEYLSEKHFQAVEKQLIESSIRFSRLDESSDFSDFLFHTLPTTGVFSL